MNLRRLLPVFLLFRSVLPSAAEEGNQETDNIFLDEVWVIIWDIWVKSPEVSVEPWSKRIHKITVPGRAVTVSIKGNNAHLFVRLSPYKSTGNKIFLMAQSEIWMQGDTEKNEYYSTLTNFFLDLGGKIHYYPLGRIGEESGTEVRMTLSVLSYLSTLNAEKKEALLNALNDFEQFDFSEKDP